LQTYTLAELLKFFTIKYSQIHYNQLHLLKSLTYFKTAESDLIPRMLKPVKWLVVKKEIEKKARAYLLK